MPSALGLVQNYTSWSTDCLFVLEHRLFGLLLLYHLMHIFKYQIKRPPTGNTLWPHFVTWLDRNLGECCQVVKVEHTLQLRPEKCANKCIAADLGRFEHTRKTFVLSIEVLQISNQWTSRGTCICAYICEFFVFVNLVRGIELLQISGQWAAAAVLSGCRLNSLLM